MSCRYAPTVLVLAAATLGLPGDCATQQPEPVSTSLAVSDARHASYWEEFYDGYLTLRDGRFAEPYIEGSSLLLNVTLNSAVSSDLDGCGNADLAAVLVTRPGGSEAFYTVHALVGRGGWARHVGSAFLGDRIHVQFVRIDGALITLRLLDRRLRESFAADPSLEVIRRFALRSDARVEISSQLSNEPGSR